VALGGRTRFLLHPGPHLPSGVGLELCPHLPWSGPGHTGQFRLLAPPTVAALALAMSAPGETELLLCELAGARSRCQLFPRVHPRQLPVARKVDAAGAPVEPLRLTADGDGYQFQLAPHEISLVRWSARAPE